MTKRLWRVRSAILAIALALAVSACVPAIPTRGDIMGVWVASPKDGQGDPACPTLQFFDDGHFVASDLPPEYFAPVPASARGEWSLDDSTNDPFSVHRLILHFDRAGALPSGFYKTLYMPVGGGSIYAGVDTHLFFDKGKACPG
jgi:hypothetical protein